ncbi:thioredoxin [Paenibacillus sp. N3/727]|uniref:thioredoxin n=1 Tax=Paenibacillus sp. N3/727 TaxID=2925845 RepID=UPI001F53947B|nr:thioredoxin [Paenibacillus sp. N3/727]UNK16388.1 thioredoxin [Paenibacillus sp. N3/727]
MLETMTKENFSELIDKGLTLVQFWAPWCGPCKMQLPIVEELSVELQDSILIGKVNADEEPELASKYGVMGLPTLILIKNGQPVEKLVGLQRKNSIIGKIQTHQ